MEDEWVAAKDLREGDILTIADGTTAVITKTYGEKLDEPVIVYNFEVRDFHTYYVTDTAVLVHNADRTGCGLGNSNSNSDSDSTTSDFDEWLNKGDSDNKVYYGIKDGEAQYTGITKQPIDARLSQHNAVGKGFSNLEIKYDGLTRNQARAIEQYFIENGPNRLNIINSISQNNKYYQNAIDWAGKYINSNGG